MLDFQAINTKLSILLNTLDICLNSTIVFAAILLINVNNNESTIISLATGIKCLPELAIKKHENSLVHDSHAEILARRALIKFAYESLIDGNTTKYFSKGKGDRKWKLNKDYELCLVTSRSPCKVSVTISYLHM